MMCVNITFMEHMGSMWTFSKGKKSMGNPKTKKNTVRILPKTTPYHPWISISTYMNS